MPYRKVSYVEQIWYIIKHKVKRAYHRWCLRNAIAHHGLKVCIYHASTNSFTVRSMRSGWRYHAYVNADGKIVFKGIAPDDV